MKFNIMQNWRQIMKLNIIEHCLYGKLIRSHASLDDPQMCFH